MLDILAITTPIYAIVLIGFLTTRFGLFSREDMRVFGSFAVNLLLPALTFRALSQRPIGETFDPTYVAAYLIATLTLVALAIAWGRKVAGMSPVASILSAMGMAAPNSGFVGYPVLLLTLPSVAGVSLALNMTMENLIVTPLLLTLAEGARSGGGRLAALRLALARLVRTPLIVGMALGLVVSLLRIPLPRAFTQTVDMFANASGAVALFVVGGTLAGMGARNLAGRVAPIVLGKLVLQPALVATTLFALTQAGAPPVGPGLAAAVLVMAATPTMTIYATLAQRYGEEEMGAAGMMATTVVSFLTLSGLLWTLDRAGMLN
ncbi:MAG: AEC family transporter [Rhizobiales bacterium]|nr:AEC family transporter [Hyphomicrobiales bacterium]